LILLQNQRVDVFPGLTVRISPTKYLVLDVAVADDFPGPYPTEPVRLSCEILSPEDRLCTMPAKCGEKPGRATAALRAGDLSVNLEELFCALDATA
jgi:hypothetical protein